MATRKGEAHAHGRLAGARDHCGLADGRNGRQRLAPKTKGADGRQIGRRAQFRGGVAQKRGLYLVGGDAVAIVGDLDEGTAAFAHIYIDHGGSCVECVFHQFFNDRSRPFHHLPCGNLGSELI